MSRNDWPVIIGFGNPKGQPFPVGVLPQQLRQYVCQVTEAYQVPADLPGCLSLAVVAASNAMSFEVQLAPDWKEPCNLYVAVVMPSGQRKSAVFRELTRPLEDAETAERCGGAPVSDAPSANAAYRRILVDDISPERLAHILAENNGRIALMSSEGGVFEMMAGRYSKGIPNLDVYLKAHSADALRVDRKMGPSAYVPHPTLTMALTVQPGVLEALAQQPLLRDRGLLARFLYAVPHSTLGHRIANPKPIELDVRNAFDARIRLLLHKQAERERKSGPAQLCLDPEARGIFREYQDLIEQRLAPGQILASVADWGGKMLGATARIAAALHSFEHAEAPAERLVETRTMHAAIVLMEYFQSHALVAFDAMVADPVIDGARKLHSWLSPTKVRQFSERSAFQENKTYFNRMSRLRPALAILEERGYIRRVAEPSYPVRGAGRPPGPRYEVNPALYQIADQNPQNSRRQGMVERVREFWGL